MEMLYMTFFLFSLSLTLSSSMMFYSITLSLYILTSAVMISIFYSSWFSCVITILYLGGLMILFLYMASMGMKSLPLSMVMSPAMLLITMMMIFMSANPFHKSQIMFSSNNLLMDCMYSTSLFWLMFILGAYLILLMITSMSLLNVKSSPLKL